MKLTLGELMLLHDLVLRHESRNEYIGLPWPDVQDLRVKIEGEINQFVISEDYEVSRVGDVK